MEVLDHIPSKLDVDMLLSKLHIKEGTEDAKSIHRLIAIVSPVINPKVVYEVSHIRYKNYDTVDIEGVILSSRVLRVNLEKAERVFPYIATCGKELDEIAIPSDDFVTRFWLDTIKDIALHIGLNYLKNYLKRKYALGRISTMSPGAGSQDLWPIEQQKQLFSIFGNVEDLIGVKLTDSFLMIPNKSVSGIIFPTEIRFESCQLCPREVCSGRKAPCNKSLLESYYSDKS